MIMRVLKSAFCLLPLLVLALAFSSCEESKEVGEFDNWQSRNDHFIDSISAVAQANSDGTWTIYKSFAVGDDYAFADNNKYFIYVQKLEDGTGEQCPEYNDSIRVHYSGRLIPSSSYPSGYNFDKSYSGSSLDPLTDVPTILCPNSTVVGFATAAMNMVVGDRWKVIIPYTLGYGQTASGSVPAYSTLIFDMSLARIYKYGIDTDTKWWSKRR